MASKRFYNGVTAEDITGPNANEKGSMQYLSEHGFAGRGILLDYWSYVSKKGIQFNPYVRSEISWDELYACGKEQGIDIRPQQAGGDVKIGDFLFIRSGFTQAYHGKSSEERAAAALRPSDEQQWAGISNEEKMVDWLHDCYFSAVAGDAPSFEAWPAQNGMPPFNYWFIPDERRKLSKPNYANYASGMFLHEHLLGLWGCPIGELLDLEKLSQRCCELNRWTFFFTSSPANCPRKLSVLHAWNMC